MLVSSEDNELDVHSPASLLPNWVGSKFEVVRGLLTAVCTVTKEKRKNEIVPSTGSLLFLTCTAAYSIPAWTLSIANSTLRVSSLFQLFGSRQIALDYLFLPNLLVYARSHLLLTAVRRSGALCPDQSSLSVCDKVPTPVVLRAWGIFDCALFQRLSELFYRPHCGKMARVLLAAVFVLHAIFFSEVVVPSLAGLEGMLSRNFYPNLLLLQRSCYWTGMCVVGASLKRAPQLRVDLAFCHDIYIGIDGPTSVFDPAPGVKVGCCRQNLRVVTLCENDLLYFTSSSNSSLIELRRSLAFDCQHWTTEQKNIRTSELNAIKSKKPGLSFASGPAGIETCSFIFRFSCASRKPFWQNNAIICIATHFRVSLFRR